MNPIQKPRSLESDLISAGVEIERTQHGFVLRRGDRLVVLRSLDLGEKDMATLGLIGARSNPGRATLNH